MRLDRSPGDEQVRRNRAGDAVAPVTRMPGVHLWWLLVWSTRLCLQGLQAWHVQAGQHMCDNSAIHYANLVGAIQSTSV